MPAQQAPSPALPLWRLGYAPEPLAWPEWKYAGGGRFDDPQGQYRVLYGAEARRTCFAEVLAKFRLSMEILAQLSAVTGTDDPVPAKGSVPSDWHLKRRSQQLLVTPDQRWLDLRSLSTLETLRTDLAGLLVLENIPDLDAATAQGPNRKATQAISRWAYDRGYQGIVYRSRLDNEIGCWAIFEDARFVPEGRVEIITRSDPDLTTIAEIYNLEI
jgi:hypothetical protein